MIKIFISYAREDFDSADKIYNELNGVGNTEIWLDKKCLLPGMNWEEEIKKNIEDSRFIILILSTNSVNKNGYIQKEISDIIDRAKYFPPNKIFIIPIRIEFCDPQHRYIKKLHYADLFYNWDEELEKIKKIIASESNAHLIPHELIQETISKFEPDLIANLTDYAEYLWRREQLFMDYNKLIEIMPNWTKQAKEDWLKRLIALRAISGNNNQNYKFTALGIKILQALG